MTKIFGEPWDAPICEDAEVVPTPVGDECHLCGEKIMDSERGIMVINGSGTGPAMLPGHAECNLRAIGGPDHVLGLCSCHGGTVEVFRAMSYREQARVSWRLAGFGE